MLIGGKPASYTLQTILTDSFDFEVKQFYIQLQTIKLPKIKRVIPIIQ